MVNRLHHLSILRLLIIQHYGKEVVYIQEVVVVQILIKDFGFIPLHLLLVEIVLYLEMVNNSEVLIFMVGHLQ